MIWEDMLRITSPAPFALSLSLLPPPTSPHPHHAPHSLLSFIYSALQIFEEVSINGGLHPPTPTKVSFPLG